MRIVMVFGVFDGVHEGHRFFLRAAKRRGDRLVAVVARDDAAESLKGRRPQKGLEERMSALRREGIADEVVEGDAVLGSWEVVKRSRPEVIVLGYDQDALRLTLEAHRDKFDWALELETAPAHRPDRYHSSILNGD